MPPNIRDGVVEGDENASLVHNPHPVGVLYRDTRSET
jgi:hypothetical protein